MPYYIKYQFFIFNFTIKILRIKIKIFTNDIMADLSEGRKLKMDIDGLLNSIANFDKQSLAGGRKKAKKTKSASKGRKLQDGGRKKAKKTKTMSKGRKEMDDELVQLGGRKKAKKSKTASKGKKSRK